MTVADLTKGPETRAQIAMLERALEVHPRVRLGQFPTPILPLDRLSEHLGGPRVWIKREDRAGSVPGGGAPRTLEFLLAEALRIGACCVVTHGAARTAHLRQTEAASAQLGLDCHVAPTAAEATALTARLRAEGAQPYLIPEGGSNALGALGYVACAAELSKQAQDSGIRFDALIHPTQSGGRQAGLLVGLCSTGSEIDLQGISVRAHRDTQTDRIHGLATATADLLGAGVVIPRRALRLHPAPPALASHKAGQLLTRLEGLTLDPEASGPALAGLIAQSRAGRFDGLSDILFLPTGGHPAQTGGPPPFDMPEAQA
ncbi:pyridoxal-phosphate dependent enzyme [Dinoroseobacter sp. S375]|uniref:pyridoxal-phosphate dependent enzyme n=1 Tax=Dinoroseobacter sp. S375 TaxID=3415136 RepID=UPI003C7B5E05